jgi:NAD(P)-dependent dehydrogenase (short-subunit alcohol dehydrogenase family)
MEIIEGRTAFVTGAAGGIGLGIATALVGAGARVVIADVDADELTRQAKALGPNAACYVLDVTDREHWPAARAFVEDRFGPLDILVNNAGIGPDLELLADMTPESFERMMRIKVTGVFNGIHTFAAGMRSRGVGHIVSTASTAGLTASARLGAYTAAKFAVVGLSEVLREEMAPHGVGVSVLCPGRVATRLAETTRALTGRTATQASAGVPTSQFVRDPATVGTLVVDAIRTNRLYIHTHREHRERVAERMQALLDAFDYAPSGEG